MRSLTRRILVKVVRMLRKNYSCLGKNDWVQKPGYLSLYLFPCPTGTQEFVSWNMYGENSIQKNLNPGISVPSYSDKQCPGIYIWPFCLGICTWESCTWASMPGYLEPGHLYQGICVWLSVPGHLYQGICV